MRTAGFFCRNVRRLSLTASQGPFNLLASQGPFSLVARPMVKDTLARMDASCNLLSCPLWGPESRGAGGAFVQLSVTSRVGTVRFVGFGTFNEEHANAEVLDEIEDEVNNDEHPQAAIEKASQELFKQSNVIGDPEDPEIEEFQVKELGREKPGADIAREVWSAKEQDGTSVFSDVSDQAASKT